MSTPAEVRGKSQPSGIQPSRTALRAIATYVSCLSIVALLTTPTVWRLTAAVEEVGSDLFVHAQMARQLVAAGQWFSYSLYYPLNYLTTGGSADVSSIRVGTTVLLTLVVAARTAVVLFYAYRYTTSWLWASAVAVATSIATPLINPFAVEDIYLGQISPNTWHNSTTLLASIFVLPTFFAILRLLSRPTSRGALITGSLLVALTLAKPSYTLALLPAATVITFVLLFRGRFSLREATVVMVTLVPAVAVMVAQSRTLTDSTYLWIAPVNYTFDPLRVWSHFSTNIPLSVLLSLTTVAIVLGAVPLTLSHRVGLGLAWTALAFAILQFALLGEEGAQGEPVFHGVWSWGLVPAAWVVLFTSLVATVLAIRDVKVQRWRRRLLYVAMAGFLLQTASGVFYLFSISVLGYPAYVV